MPPGPVLRRRTALLGVAATALVAGCDHGDDIGEPVSSGSPSPATASPSDAPQTPDEVLVDGVLIALDLAVMVLVPARKISSLREQVQPLLRAHRQHVAVLGGQPVDVPDVPLPSPATALRGVRQAEERLRATLVDAAGKAESGALAKLLASVSASVTQHLDTLPEKA